MLLNGADAMGSKTASNYDGDFLVSLYKEMVFYRKFEELVNLAYTKRKFSGFCHLHIGQEAVCVGVQRNLRASDYILGSYRTHTLAIAKGISPTSVLAELYGREGGCSKGRGGSMHMFSKEHRFLGGHGIVGGQAPIAAGVGFKIKYSKEDDIVVCLLGDAAMNQGAVFEAMNMVAVWDLPVLYLIENNCYGMGTDIKRTTNVEHLHQIGQAFNMPNDKVDGMNVLHVYEKVKEVVGQVREKRQPYLLEVLTYRYKGHSVSDPGLYRTKKEVEEYQKLDPILQLGEMLIEQKLANADDLKNWQREAKEVVKAAEVEAESSPFPKNSDAERYVFAE
ncbi:MAG: pyruvate dehydrogenase (acetyl-transferring) E1 component subunit alpha [Bdellovibrionota bacterium]